MDSFFSRRDLELLTYLRQQRRPLADVTSPEFYIRQGEQRTVRPYQQQAMKALDYSLELGKRRFLMERPPAPARPTWSAST